MKQQTKKGILATMVLEQLDPDTLDFILEQEVETKPSRLENKRTKNKKRSRKDYDKLH